MVHLESEDVPVEGDGTVDLADPEHGVVEAAYGHGGAPEGSKAGFGVTPSQHTFKFELPGCGVAARGAGRGGGGPGNVRPYGRLNVRKVSTRHREK
ncbi:hypothetical protein GCM10010371_59830 [Streptomyces subrutilus]|uniref:Uncharacterized protein n=1 Tax=Streptomyces subrutilus TaxID=36818 RepID=A0A918RB85_9ACTN|nr:hypothetical protein GCM10010371_59830 [Streptomyces subrutilus]